MDFLYLCPKPGLPPLFPKTALFWFGRWYGVLSECRTGDIIWTYTASNMSEKVIGNGRMISICPVRTGIIVKENTVYFAAGLFPTIDVYVIALNAETGTEIWREKQDQLTPQGYPVASDLNFYVPTSRTQPFGFKLTNGKLAEKYTGPLGTYISLQKNKLLYGMNDKGRITSDDFLAEALLGHQIIEKNNIYYVASEYRLTAINKSAYDDIISQIKQFQKKEKEAADVLKDLRKQKNLQKGQVSASLDVQIDKKLDDILKSHNQLELLKNKRFLWQKSINIPYSMILTKNLLIVGEDNKVNAFRISDGQLVWNSPVNGRAYGLAVADGKLYVSTDSGQISCFTSKKANQCRLIKPTTVVNPYKKDKYTSHYSSAAEHILSDSHIQRGFCLVLDCGEGRLAYELANRSKLQIIGIEKDQNKVSTAREYLDKAGLLGNRITLFQGSLKELHFPDYFANLIVSDKLVTSRNINEPFDELYRLLRPSGGMIYLGQPKGKLTKKDLEKYVRNPELEWDVSTNNGLWAKAKREKLSDSGEWTHLYADPGNTAASRDKLVNDNLAIQWFGAPGPREMTDRHHRNVSPLFKNGILVIPGNNRVMAADAYNGTPLWSKIIPNFRRLNISRDAGNMVLTDEYLYVATETRCLLIDPLTGTQTKEFVCPQILPETTRYWGYTAIKDNQLFGSGRKPDAIYDQHSYQGDDEVWTDFGDLVTSDYIFSLDRHNGELQWSYNNGVIINSTMTIGNNRMFFIESHEPEALQDQDGMVTLDKLIGSQAYLVALDIFSGKVIWKKPFQPGTTLQSSVFINYANDIFVVTISKNKDNKLWYDLNAYEAQNGNPLWQQTQKNKNSTGGSHGEQTLHPVIMNNEIFAEPFRYNLQTGALITDWKLTRLGNGCGTIAGSTDQLFFRAKHPAFCEINETDLSTRINSVSRPGCWINMIPAGGLVLIPESSSGCTCDFPLQMSVAYVAKNNDLEIKDPECETIFKNSVSVDLQTESKTGQIYYTQDGSEPTLNSLKYSKPIFFTESTTIKAKAFLKDKCGSTKTIILTKLEYLEPQDPKNILPGLAYDYYEGYWSYSLDFAGAKPKHSGIVSNFDLKLINTRKEYLGIKFTGYIDIAADGLYTFYSNSNDGSTLFIDDQLVINNDHILGWQEESGQIGLKAGKHSITVLLFQGAGGKDLQISYEGTNIERQAISETMLFHEK